MGKLSIENYLNLSSERGIWFEEIVFTDELCSALYSFYGHQRVDCILVEKQLVFPEG